MAYLSPSGIGEKTSGGGLTRRADPMINLASPSVKRSLVIIVTFTTEHTECTEANIRISLGDLGDLGGHSSIFANRDGTRSAK